MNVSSTPSNKLLATLSATDLAALQPHLKFVELLQGTVLFEIGETVNRVYFPHGGVVSLVIELASGETIETAMVGRESVVGGSSAVDGRFSLCKAIVQIAGAASVLDADRLRNLADANADLRSSLIHHEQLILVQALQSAACNATHTVEARLARWLLRCRDLTGGDDLQLTQEFVAQMLGVRRTSVSVVAHTLQQAGFIRYHRGNIRILNLDGLRETACECYETVKAHSDRLLGPTLTSDIA